MKLCLSVAPRSMEEAIALLRQYHRKIGLVEVRVDLMKRVDFGELLRQPRPDVIITNRRHGEGGSFSGTASGQLDVLSTAARFGAEYVDVELSWGTKMIRRLISLSAGAKTIVSHHDMNATPGNLGAVYQRARSLEPDVVKIAVMARSIADNRALFDLCERAKSDRQPLIALCMGEHGEISRILAARLGAFLTFGAVAESSVTAPGQLTYDQLKNVFRVQKLNSRTKLFGLIGNPVKQSRGIFYHNAIFKRRGLNAVYVNLLTDDMDRFFETLSGPFTGFSVTMPFKQQVVPYVHRLEGDAGSLGIVNTIIRRRHLLFGYNTDLPALAGILKKRLNLRSKRVAIIGTGATAKTMAFLCVNRGAKPTIVGRDAGEARRLAAEMNVDWNTPEELTDIGCDLLMNATPANMGTNQSGGMKPLLIPTSAFRKGMVVFDAVYEPAATPMLRHAEMSGCTVISGIELFRRQARLQSRLFLEAIS